MDLTAAAPSGTGLSGHTLLGSSCVPGTGPPVRAQDPVQNVALEPPFADSSLQQVDGACTLAGAAFDEFRAAPLEARAALLEGIADQLLELGDLLIARAMAETGLPRPRLEGERARTAGQLRMFAAVVRSGHFLGLTQDTALPERAPLPRPDLRLRRIPVGPVAVFGASNFPLAFSVAGGDTASALAAGCPVVAKAHPSHPGTSELAGLAIQRAVAASGLPGGVFSLLHGHRHEIGGALAEHPAICAIGFTGSRAGGLSLVRLAACRRVPVPVYAEMSSINPVFLLPGALQARGAAIAKGFADSLTLGTGQFCTQPGLVFTLEGPATEHFLDVAAETLEHKASTPMLNEGICTAYARGAAALREQARVKLKARGLEGTGGLSGRPHLFTTDLLSFQAHPELAEELFGPSSLVVLCRTEAELLAAAEALEGQLTATLQIDAADYPLAAKLLPALERKAGRILANGFPTGVEVSYAMVHGGPFPATADGRSTSVGATAIERFLRPVCYQALPQDLLPTELRDGNPLPRLIDGR